MTADHKAAPDRCPRCGGAFHCGVDDAQPCPCTTIKLDGATLAALERQYRGCLCLRCLAELAPQGAARLPTSPSG